MATRAKIFAAIKELEFYGFRHTAVLLRELLEKHDKVKGGKHVRHESK